MKTLSTESISPKTKRLISAAETVKILAIDPGTNYMGWSLYEVPRTYFDKCANVTVARSLDELQDYITVGTIYGKGTNIDSMSTISEKVLDLIETHKPHLFIVENYHFIPGKARGSTGVPSLIMLLRYHWYKCTDTDAHLAVSQTWKSAICRARCAQKAEIRDLITALFPSLTADLLETFKDVKHQGEQDAVDAIGIGLYGVLLVWQILTEDEFTL